MKFLQAFLLMFLVSAGQANASYCVKSSKVVNNHISNVQNLISISSSLIPTAGSNKFRLVRSISYFESSIRPIKKLKKNIVSHCRRGAKKPNAKLIAAGSKNHLDRGIHLLLSARVHHPKKLKARLEALQSLAEVGRL